MKNGVCWYCGGQLVWQTDCAYDDLYHDGEGVISFLNCLGCGAEVEYRIKLINIEMDLRERLSK